jgi:[ribosomal protein S5]-alanine N-acetyltransferase
MQLVEIEFIVFFHPIGTMGLWRMDKENHRAGIGYLPDHEYQGRGLASEALHAILAYGFNE